MCHSRRNLYKIRRLTAYVTYVQHSAMSPIPYYVANGSKRKTVKSAPLKLPPNKIRKYKVKNLSVCYEPKEYNAAIKAAPDNVIKTICNAALNVQKNKRVHLSPAHRALFKRHSSAIERLVSKSVALSKKRKILQQRGGAFWIPALIGAAISTIGSSLFGGNKS